MTSGRLFGCRWRFTGNLAGARYPYQQHDQQDRDDDCTDCKQQPCGLRIPMLDLNHQRLGGARHHLAGGVDRFNDKTVFAIGKPEDKSPGKVAVVDRRSG